MSFISDPGRTDCRQDTSAGSRKLLLPVNDSPALFSHHTISIGDNTIHQICMPLADTAVLHKIGQIHNIFLPDNIRQSRHKRQTEFIAGRLAAKYALLQYGYSNFNLKTGSQGQPLFPESLQGSLSHTSNQRQCLAIACVQKKQPTHRFLGIDIEYRQHQSIMNEHKSTLTLFLRAAELRYITEHSTDLPLMALLLFSAKESIIKAWFHQYQKLINFTDIAFQSYRHSYLNFLIDSPLTHANPQTAEVCFHCTKEKIITIAYI